MIFASLFKHSPLAAIYVGFFSAAASAALSLKSVEGQEESKGTKGKVGSFGRESALLSVKNFLDRLMSCQCVCFCCLHFYLRSSEGRAVPLMNRIRPQLKRYLCKSSAEFLSNYSVQSTAFVWI